MELFLLPIERAFRHSKQLVAARYTADCKDAEHVRFFRIKITWRVSDLDVCPFQNFMVLISD
jgi:hypothetical protein